MRTLTVHPVAKINLGLNIVNRRSDGYHDLETVFYPVGLHDTLTITEATAPQTHDCELTLEGIEVLGDLQDNLVVKAYKLLKAECPQLPQVTMRLSKGIPTQAGMGGGSADGAYALTALNTLFALRLTDDRLRQLAAQLGADCAFFVSPQPMYACGIGDRLQPVALDLRGVMIAIVKPSVAISTREAFARIVPARPSMCCRDVVQRPLATWRSSLTNDFEASIFPSHPEIATIKRQLYDMGALYAAMSGSGSAVFGLFDNCSSNAVEQAFPNCFTAVLHAEMERRIFLEF